MCVVTKMLLNLNNDKEGTESHGPLKLTYFTKITCLEYLALILCNNWKKSLEESNPFTQP